MVGTKAYVKLEYWQTLLQLAWVLLCKYYVFLMRQRLALRHVMSSWNSLHTNLLEAWMQQRIHLGHPAPHFWHPAKHCHWFAITQLLATLKLSHPHQPSIILSQPNVFYKHSIACSASIDRVSAWSTASANCSFAPSFLIHNFNLFHCCTIDFTVLELHNWLHCPRVAHLTLLSLSCTIDFTVLELKNTNMLRNVALAVSACRKVVGLCLLHFHATQALSTYCVLGALTASDGQTEAQSLNPAHTRGQTEKPGWRATFCLDRLSPCKPPLQNHCVHQIVCLHNLGVCRILIPMRGLAVGILHKGHRMFISLTLKRGKRQCKW